MSAVAGSKRKRLGEAKFYAVQAGRRPGIYTSWNECMDQIRGFKGAKFKSFPTAEDAALYLTGKDPSLDPNSSSYTAKFYGVRSGKVPGVYTDWESAEKQVKGVAKPKVKAFATREEAEAFVDCGPTVAKPLEPNSRSHQAHHTPPPPPPQQPPEEEPDDDDEDDDDDDDDDDDEDDELATLSKSSLYDPVASRRDGPPAAKKQAVAIDDLDLSSSSSPEDVLAIGREHSRSSKNDAVLKIYTDGSAVGNGQPGSTAGIGVWFGEQDARNISEPLAGPRQTNQRAELTAILRALNVAPPHRHVHIYTDSQYSIKCVTVWHHNWVRKDWITSVGRPVENRDLVEAIINKIREREKQYGSTTKFEWVKGHTGRDDGNSMADLLAVQGARMPRDTA